MKAPKLLVFISLVALFCSCTKNFSNPTGPSSSSDSSGPSTADSPNGMFYISILGGSDVNYIKLGAANDSIYWNMPQINYGSSWGNPLSFDSDYFYNGNPSSITCYNSATGSPVWEFWWLAAANGLSYREPAFNDSLIFVTSPTNVGGGDANLYCNNKRTGAAKWQVSIDAGYADSEFNAIPVVNGNNVLTLTRDQNDQKYLTAFSVQNGSMVWSVPVDNSMHSKLMLSAGKIYSAYGPLAVCYDASNGQLLWQTNIDMNVPAGDRSYTYNFIDGNTLIVVDILSNTDYKILQIQTATGAIVKSSDLTISTTYPSAPFYQLPAQLNCAYSKNTLYIASFYSVDSLDILSYNITTMSQNWKQRFGTSLDDEDAPVLTDKFLMFPINEQINNSTQTNMVVLDLNGKLIKELPFTTLYTTVFDYVENGVVYQQTESY